MRRFVPALPAPRGASSTELILLVLGVAIAVGLAVTLLGRETVSLQKDAVRSLDGETRDPREAGDPAAGAVEIADTDPGAIAPAGDGPAQATPTGAKSPGKSPADPAPGPTPPESGLLGAVIDRSGATDAVDPRAAAGSGEPQPADGSPFGPTRVRGPLSGLPTERPAGVVDPADLPLDDLVAAVTAARREHHEDEGRLDVLRRANRDLQRTLEEVEAEDPSSRNYVFTRANLDRQLERVRHDITAAPEDQLPGLLARRENLTRLLAAIPGNAPGVTQEDLRLLLHGDEREIARQTRAQEARRATLEEFERVRAERTRLLNDPTTPELREALARIDRERETRRGDPEAQTRLAARRAEISRELQYRERAADPAALRAEGQRAFAAVANAPRTSPARIAQAQALERLLAEVDLPYKTNVPADLAAAIRSLRADLDRVRTTAPSRGWAATPLRDAIEELESLGVHTQWFRTRLDNGEIQVEILEGTGNAAALFVHGVLKDPTIQLGRSSLINGQALTSDAGTILHELFHAYLHQNDTNRINNRDLGRAYVAQIEDLRRTEASFDKGESAASLADEIGAHYISEVLIPRLREIREAAVDVQDALARYADAFSADNLSIILGSEYTNAPGPRAVRLDFALAIAQVIGIPKPSAGGEFLEDRPTVGALTHLLRDRPPAERATLAEEREYAQRLDAEFRRASADPANAEAILREVLSGPGRNLASGRRFPARLLVAFANRASRSLSAGAHPAFQRVLMEANRAESRR